MLCIKYKNSGKEHVIGVRVRKLLPMLFLLLSAGIMGPAVSFKQVGVVSKIYILC